MINDVKELVIVFLGFLFILPLLAWFQHEKYEECLKSNTKKYCMMNIGK